MDHKGIIAPFCVSHDCIVRMGSINIPLQKRKFQDLIPLKKEKKRKGKLMILGLSDTPNSGAWLSMTTIDVGLNNDFDN